MSVLTDQAGVDAGDLRSATVVGASGFTGGELLRLLDGHPTFEVAQATSRSYAGRSVGAVHPPMRESGLRFSEPTDLDSVDVLFAATPHGVSMEHIDTFREAADLVVDLSADFRLPTAEAYDEWYDGHERPDLVGEAVYALPELHRDDLVGADLIAAGGCNATAAILGLLPLISADLVGDGRIVVDVKVGSSEGGTGGGAGSNHAERSGVVRPYAPTGHRHEAEIESELGVEVSMTCHAVDMVRGAAATCHVFPDDRGESGGRLSKADCWGAFREAYGDEPFVRLLGGGSGLYRYPEPKAVAGTNYAEVGFALDGDRVVVFSAIDNLMKGSAGQAVHAANVALGLDETAGLTFQGLHPVGKP